MIVLLHKGASEAEVRDIVAATAVLADVDPVVVRHGEETIVHAPGRSRASEDLHGLRALPSVARVIAKDPAWLLAAREVHPDDTVVIVGDVEIGGRRTVIAAGPCSVEDEDQLRAAAEAAAEGGARLLRGGAFKPRTSPWAFQGLGERGLEMLRAAADSLDMQLVTEVMAPEQVSLVGSYADMLQVGSRNIQNFPLLRAVGSQEKPVLLKRGMMSTVDEFLGSAEYILSHGNPHVVLCERGIRTFETRTRNTFDLSVIPLLKTLTHLPVLADPSHGTGRSELVIPCGLGALAAGADGLIVEIHPRPEEALSDGPQALRPGQFLELSRRAARVVEAVGRAV
jgi:3-deoxy-7-phosphoheptulonate synthase